MSRYETVALKPAVAERARALAKHLGIPISALVATLIDGAFRNEFGDHLGAVEQNGDRLRIKLGGDVIEIPLGEAGTVAATIAQAAAPDERFRGNLNLDVPCMLFVGRKGSGVVFEATKPDQTKVRQTMGVHDAKLLAQEIAAFV